MAGMPLRGAEEGISMPDAWSSGHRLAKLVRGGPLRPPIGIGAFTVLPGKSPGRVGWVNKRPRAGQDRKGNTCSTFACLRRCGRAAGLVAMCGVRGRRPELRAGGGHGELAVDHTLDGDQAVGDVPDIVGLAAHGQDLEAIVVVEVDVEG